MLTVPPLRVVVPCDATIPSAPVLPSITPPVISKP